MTSKAPDNTRIYAIGDIHGRADLLLRLLDMIAKDNAGYKGHIQLIFLGDYIDRGYESRKVIDIMLTLGEGPVFLKGNHDEVMLQILRDSDFDLSADWMQFGGREAALSYGVQPPTSINATTLKNFVHQLQAAVPVAHIEFFAKLKTSVTFGDYYFCHAGVRPGRSLAEQAEEDLLWIRGDFLLHNAPYEKMVIHGHTVTVEPDIHSNRIGIDTGAYATGKLTALALEGDKQWFLHTN